MSGEFLVQRVFIIIFQIGLKMFLLIFLFSKYCIKVFFTYNMIFLLVSSVCCASSVVVVVSVCCVGGCVVVGAWLFGCLGLCCLCLLVGAWLLGCLGWFNLWCLGL